MSKIITAEDLQTELKTIWALTEEENPSRKKMAEALQDLATKLVSPTLTGVQEVILSRQPLVATDWTKVCAEAEKFRDALQRTLRIKVVITITITDDTITITVTIKW
jgi:hypothetical protein